MRITWVSLATITGAVVGLISIITAGYQLAVWVDNRYVDVHEAQLLVEKQTDVLKIMNDNIVNIGTVIYDRKLADIDQWIKDLESRKRNPAEDAFLQSLRESKKEVIAAKAKLSTVKIGQ